MIEQQKYCKIKGISPNTALADRRRRSIIVTSCLPLKIPIVVDDPFYAANGKQFIFYEDDFAEGALLLQ